MGVGPVQDIFPPQGLSFIFASLHDISLHKSLITAPVAPPTIWHYTGMFCFSDCAGKGWTRVKRKEDED